MRQLKHQAPSPSFDLSSSLRMALLSAAPEWGLHLVLWGCREHHQTVSAHLAGGSSHHVR